MTETCDVHYQGSVCAYSGLPAADACPVATEGTLEMLPENERILTGQVTSEDSQRVCEHSSVFMATPGADQIIEQERLELQLRSNSAQYEALLVSLQQQLQTAVEDKAIADQELAAAADDNAKAAAQSAVDEAQHRIDSLNAQINQLNAAQTSVQTQSAAAAPSSDGSAADNVPVDDGNVKLTRLQRIPEQLQKVQYRFQKGTDAQRQSPFLFWKNLQACTANLFPAPTSQHLFQNNVGILSFFSGRYHAVRLFGALVIGKPLDLMHLCARLIIVQERLISLPDHRYNRISRHDLHQDEMLGIVLIQRKQRQNRRQKLCRTDSIRPDHPLSDAAGRKVRIRQHDLVSVSHFIKNF